MSTFTPHHFANLPLPSDAPPEKPFRVELLREDERGDYFKPAARLIVTRGLRTTGLLRDLPDAEAKTLLLLITFQHSDGRCEVSVMEAATALNISSAKARSRLDRLAEVVVNGTPVVHAMRRESGLDGYILSRSLVEVSTASKQPAPPEPVLIPSRREEVIAHSRANYAHPRAEVEARILTEQLGYAPAAPVDMSTPEGAARQAMGDIGLRQEQIDLLITSFPIETITQQIAWLPHRHPKDPPKLLVSAIRYGYEPPAFIRLQQAIEVEGSATSGGAATERDAGQNGGGV